MTDVTTRLIAEDKTKGAIASAKKGLQELSSAAKSAGQETGGLTGLFGKFSSGLGGANSAIKLLTGGVAGLAAAMGGQAILGGAQALYNMGQQAAGLRNLRSAFDELARSAGASGGAMMAAMRQASQGMIADQDLVLAANRAMMLGVADTAGEMQELMQVAISRGQAMGMDATSAFNDLVTGLGRMSPMILDNLGIVANAERAYATYAESIGKATEELSDAERKQALVNDVLAENTASLAKDNPFAQLSAAGANLKDLLGQVLLPGIEAFAQGALDFLEPVIERIERINRNLENERKNQAQKDLWTLGSSIDQLAKSLSSATAQQSLDLFRGIAPSQEELNRIEMLQSSLQSLGEQYNAAAQITGAPLIDLNLLSLGIRAFDETTEAAEDLVGALPTVGTAAAQAAQQMVSEYQNARNAIAQQGIDMAQALGLGGLATNDLIAQYADMFDVLVDHGVSAEAAMKQIFDRMARDTQVLEEAARQTGIALADSIAWGAEQAAGSIATFVGYASSALSSVFGWLGGITDRMNRTQLEGATPKPNSGGVGGLGQGGAAPGSSGSTRKGPRTPSVAGFLPMSAKGLNDWPGLSDLDSAASGAASSLSGLDSTLQGMLQKVPGLFGASEVTQDQLDMAAMGIPQNFADDYLRKLTDEVLNGVDWQDVSIEDAAARAGIDPNLPKEMILKMFSAAWKDSSLFSNPANLELINQDAVKAALEQQNQSEAGKLNIMSLFGIDTTEQQAQVAALGIQIRDGIVTGVGDPEGMTDAAGPYIANIGSQLDSKDAADAQRNLGKNIAERVNAGFVEAAKGLPWGPPTGGGSWTPPKTGGAGDGAEGASDAGGTGGKGAEATSARTVFNTTFQGSKIDAAQFEQMVRSALRKVSR